MEPSVGLDVVVVFDGSPTLELTVTVFVEPEVEVLGDMCSVAEFVVTVDVDPETGFDILGIEYFFMNLFWTSSPSGGLCCTSLELESDV